MNMSLVNILAFSGATVAFVFVISGIVMAAEKLFGSREAFDPTTARKEP